MRPSILLWIFSVLSLAFSRVRGAVDRVLMHLGL